MEDVENVRTVEEEQDEDEGDEEQGDRLDTVNVDCTVFEEDGPGCACLFAALAKACLPALERVLPAICVATISNDPRETIFDDGTESDQ